MSKLSWIPLFDTFAVNVNDIVSNVWLLNFLWCIIAFLPAGERRVSRKIYRTPRGHANKPQTREKVAGSVRSQLRESRDVRHHQHTRIVRAIAERRKIFRGAQLTNVHRFSLNFEFIENGRKSWKKPKKISWRGISLVTKSNLEISARSLCRPNASPNNYRNKIWMNEGWHGRQCWTLPRRLTLIKFVKELSFVIIELNCTETCLCPFAATQSCSARLTRTAMHRRCRKM